MTIELDGEHAPVQSHTNVPSLYLKARRHPRAIRTGPATKKLNQERSNRKRSQLRPTISTAAHSNPSSPSTASASCTRKPQKANAFSAM